MFFSGYTRGAVVDRNEFVSIGETAISQWGYVRPTPTRRLSLLLGCWAFSDRSLRGADGRQPGQF